MEVSKRRISIYPITHIVKLEETLKERRKGGAEHYTKRASEQDFDE